MASKKQRASSNSGSGASSSPQQAQGQGPGLRATTMLSTLRLVALMSATIVALLVFEVLEHPIGFWPALGVGFVSGIVARAAFLWLERAWLHAAARRAAARAGQAKQTEPPRNQGKRAKG